MKERINTIIQSEGLSSSKFADRIGVQRSSISHILSGRNNPSMDFIQKILLAFPEIEAEWLLLGKGDMYKNLDNAINFAGSDDKNEAKVIQKGRTEYDLFSQDIISGPETRKTVKDNIPDKISPSKDDIGTSDHEKAIDKIVILYKDKTFVEYKPE